MSRRRVLLGLTLALAPAGARVAAQEPENPAPQAEETTGEEARPAPTDLEAAPSETPPDSALAREATELPRAEPGRWQGLFEGTQLAEDLDLDDELVRSMVAAEQAYRRADYPGAVTELWKTLEREPDFPPALLLLGNTYFRLRRYDDLVVTLERFDELAPGQVFRTQALAHGYYALGDYGRAREHYERVLASMEAKGLESSPEARRGLALSCMRLGDTERALELLRAVVEERPGHADALGWIAQILYDEDRLEEGLEAARKARNLAPYEPRPWYLLSQLLLELGQDEEAEEARARWQELDRVEQEVRVLEGNLLYAPGDFGAALKLVELHRSIGDVLSTRAALERVLAWRPQEVRELDVRLLALQALADLGDRAGANRAAMELQRCCSEEADTWRALAEYFGSIDEPELRIQAIERMNRLLR